MVVIKTDFVFLSHYQIEFCHKYFVLSVKNIFYRTHVNAKLTLTLHVFGTFVFWYTSSSYPKAPKSIVNIDLDYFSISLKTHAFDSKVLPWDDFIFIGRFLKPAENFPCHSYFRISKRRLLFN
jgi:hypothetical protein